MAGLDRGHFEVVNPYNRKISRVTARPDQVHSIVFWSKDFGDFLAHDYGKVLEQRGFHLFFNFTINSPQPQLEPQVPPLDARLEQLAQLCAQHGPACIQWRFDPICYFTNRRAEPQTNLDQFETIARCAARYGIDVCITSFVDLYRKVQRRLKSEDALRLYDPPMAAKSAQIMEMAAVLADLDIQLHLCCEKEVLAALPHPTVVQPAACIPTGRLASLYGPGLDPSQDPGQRKAEGCRCGVSKDIGSYALHPCHHNCLFCYANPSSDNPSAKH